MGRRLYWASLGLAPIVIVAHEVFDASGTLLFVLSAAAIAPLAFLIGEATENVGEHTGPGVGGFLNASFGNAPELIIGLFAIANTLPNVVRGTITGSVVSTALLVLGGAMVFGGDGVVERRSLLDQCAMIACALALFLIPSVPGWHGNPDRHGLYVLTLPVAAVLLVFYVSLTTRHLRAQRAAYVEAPSPGAWRLRSALLALAVATVATAFVSEELVRSLGAFARALGLSQFFVAAVVVAIVGNAAEHGGAIVVARRGNPQLAAEIAISSATQIAVLVAPLLALVSGLIGNGLPLSFRPVEIGTMAVAVLAVWAVVIDGRLRRWEGFLLLGVYLVAVAAFVAAGDRY